MSATASALASAGYAALRVEDIAARSGVNKTTIYRRWPTKADLVAATLEHLRPVHGAPYTGRVRDDLLAMLREIIAACDTPIGRGITRMLQIERGDPEVERIARTLRRNARATRERCVQAAIDAGELPRGTSAALVAEMVVAPIVLRVVINNEPIDDADVCRIVDTVLAGVHASDR